ncbi:MAG: hypothetical protein KDE58_04460 [Caldilineaceae bacterium]|nr:hypothetical protein [Caldilineaceae bacterium]
MTTIQLQTEISLVDLLQGVQHLDSTTLEEFADEVMLLRAKRRAPSISKAETELLRQINLGLSERTRSRFHDLKQKRDAATLTPAEYEELLAIIDQIEAHDVERLEALAELAAMRNVPVRQLMHQLGLLAKHDE